MKNLKVLFCFLLFFAFGQLNGRAHSSLLPLPSEGEKPQANVTICHYSEEEDTFHAITVNENALPAHLGHGDGFPGECVPGATGYRFDENCVVIVVNEICGNGIDDDCDGQTDEGDGIYDDVCDADCLVLGVSTPFSNAGATVQPGEVDPGPGSGNSTCSATDGWCGFEPQPFLDNTVWFTFVAPESGCVDVGALDADLQIAVWSVGDCSDFSTFTEIGANDDSGPGFAPFLDNLPVTAGQTYYVQIDGYNGIIESNGLVFVKDCAAPIPECAVAPEIFCGDVITGSTTGGNPNVDLISCGTSLNTAKGAWYKFIGTGEDVTLTTCNPLTDYDTKIGVFTGACTANGLVCVAGNDDADCPIEIFRSTLTFFAVNGEEYHVYITGFAASVGTYELSVACGPGPTAAGKGQLWEEVEESIEVGKVYPNPTGSTANVEISVPRNTTGYIQVFDNFGRLAHKQEVGLSAGANTIEVDVHDLAQGAYFIRIAVDKEMFHKNLIIAR